MDMEAARKILKAHWGYDDFRPAQGSAIAKVLAGNDVLAVLPTGYGKTAIFQIPAMLAEGCALVISPLISLMKDQTDDCLKRGIPASFVNSHVTDTEAEKRLKAWAAGAYKVFYVAPERIANPAFREAVVKARVSWYVIDESHCHPPETLIALPDGRQVRIDTVSVGDLVLSDDGRSVVSRRVTEHRTSGIGHRFLLRIATLRRGSVTLTEDHKVYRVGTGYVEAEEVRAGDTLLRLVAEGRPSPMFHVREVKVHYVEVMDRGDADRQLHSLTVEGDHNYFAGGIKVGNCASTWGHDFRPAYRRLKDLLPLIAYEEHGVAYRPPILAFTATATQEVVDDIASALGMDAAFDKVVADPVRPNLQYRVVRSDPWQVVDDLSRAWDPQRGSYVIYCPTQRLCHEVCDGMVERFPGKVGVYHAGLNREERTLTQDAFKAGTVPIIVATCAFGMGIDVPNIRAVVHYGIPGSMEAYAQESGRAGRDGLHSDCVLIYTEKSHSLQEWFISLQNPPYVVYEKLWAWLNETLAPGQSLTMSGRQIAEALVGGRTTDVFNSDTINGAMSTMNAYGMVLRSPVPYGTMATVDTVSMLDAVSTGTVLTPAVKPVAQAIWKMVKDQWSPVPAKVDVGIDRAHVAEMAGVKVDAVSRALAQMRSKGLLVTAPADYGKTTQILRAGELLADILPASEVAKKRKRDDLRLKAMVDYTHVLAGRHPDFIRSYFLSPEKKGKP